MKKPFHHLSWGILWRILQNYRPLSHCTTKARAWLILPSVLWGVVMDSVHFSCITVYITTTDSLTCSAGDGGRGARGPAVQPEPEGGARERPAQPEGKDREPESPAQMELEVSVSEGPAQPKPVAMPAGPTASTSRGQRTVWTCLIPTRGPCTARSAGCYAGGPRTQLVTTATG